MEPFDTAPWLTAADTSEKSMMKDLPSSTADKHLGTIGGKGCSGASMFISSYGTNATGLFRSFGEL